MGDVGNLNSLSGSPYLGMLSHNKRLTFTKPHFFSICAKQPCTKTEFSLFCARLLTFRLFLTISFPLQMKTQRTPYIREFLYDIALRT